jgi:fatty-acyl-CoA synthase
MSNRHMPFRPPQIGPGLGMPPSSVWQNLERSAARFGEKTCLVFHDQPISYARVKTEAQWLAGFLQRECGVQRGDRVALYMHNCAQFVIAYYAILRADAMVVPINPMSVTAELERLSVDSGARVVLTAQPLFAQVEPLLDRCFRHVVVACYSDYMAAQSDLPVPAGFRSEPFGGDAAGVTLWREVLAKSIEPAPHLAQADDLCVLPYTSGTTGKPKGCTHRHRNVMHSLMSSASWFGTCADDCILAALPLFHVTGMQASMNLPIALGATFIVLPRWDRSAAATVIQRYRVNRWACVPAMMIDLLAGLEIERYDLTSLKSISGGGASMPEAVARQLKSRLGLEFIEGYGLSETMAPTHLNPEHRSKRQCVGIPIFDTDSRIVDPDDLRELPPGEVGEIVTRGPQVFEGYWNQPQASAECFVEIEGQRFFRTGDLGRTDEEGYFFFVDRLKRMINAGGFKVWPAEVEAELHAHPAIREAVVIASYDARRGEGVKAVVVLRPGSPGAVTADELESWARQRMAAYKVPRAWEFVEALPRSESGKVLWRALQERELAAGRGGER